MPKMVKLLIRYSRAAVLAVLAFAAVSVAQTSRPASDISSPPAGVDRALWAKLLEIDSRASRTQILVASFRQEKFTALLKKPLVSTGTIRLKGSTMRWDTQQPQKSVLWMNEREARIFYPQPPPGVVEIYPLDQRMGELASSPLPRLAVLKRTFSFDPIPAAQVDRGVDPAKFLALRLTPLEASLREHIAEVRVLLDIAGAYIVKAEMTDADGDRTVLKFSDVKVNGDAGDLELNVPSGTKITHPLEGMPTGRGKP